jgi:preprotein translocase subunit SecA
LRGDPIEVDLRVYDADLTAVNTMEAGVRGASDETLAARAQALRDRARAGTPLDDLRHETFAVLRETAVRAVGMRPFDVQVIAALALHRGRIVEMQTGEGKTLAAVLPAALHAFTGLGVHVLTFNDYLARRDADWMGPIYRRVGLTVGVVQEGMSADERRRAYAADVTYLTAKEAGFDYLRDHLVMRADDRVHRPFQFALVDEADSIMIDEARVPLVIAGRMPTILPPVHRLAALVASFTAGVEYDFDEYQRDVELTDAGIDRVERALGCGRLHDASNLALLTQVNCALHAHTLLRRDIDYIVRHGRIETVDEFTGRVVRDRYWPDGLQAAIEAKEGIARGGDGEILGSITLQHFLTLYPRRCGMTGTARTAAAELHDTYGLPVTVVPTHRPMIRIDHADVVFSDRELQQAAVVDEVRRVHGTGQPILVGTLSVEESERLAARLRSTGMTCDVLNAKHDEAESAIVAQAGRVGAVTISTNMAGRGTDIKLDWGTASPGPPHAVARGDPDAPLGSGGARQMARLVDSSGGSASRGGLYVLGTNRHESRRVDLQLRGRAGRQGDPGESRFFISLDDDLLVKYGLRRLLPRWAQSSSPDPIDDPIVRREIARAQRIIEGQNREIRKTLSRYADVVEQQRRILMERRRRILEGADAGVWHGDAGRNRLAAAAGEQATRDVERTVTLFHLDRAWRDHLAFAADLREGIHLVTLAGKDPLTHYTLELIRAFEGIDNRIDVEALATLQRIDVRSGRIDLDQLGIRGPSSTWTYLVNDDPFQDQLIRLLAGPGRATIAMYSGVVLMPLLLLWTITARLMKRRTRRGS